METTNKMVLEERGGMINQQQKNLEKSYLEEYNSSI